MIDEIRKLHQEYLGVMHSDKEDLPEHLSMYKDESIYHINTLLLYIADLEEMLESKMPNGLFERVIKRMHFYDNTAPDNVIYALAIRLGGLIVTTQLNESLVDIATVALLGVRG